MTEHTGELCLSRKNSRALPRYVTPNWSPWQTNREVHKRIKKTSCCSVCPAPPSAVWHLFVSSLSVGHLASRDDSKETFQYYNWIRNQKNYFLVIYSHLMSTFPGPLNAGNIQILRAKLLFFLCQWRHSRE